MKPARTSFVELPQAKLFVREIGHGRPLFILHGGPDFDHTYMVPAMDELAAFAGLVYYDQRGRGRSSGSIEDLCIASEVEDLDGLRKHFGFETIAVLGHSWGAVLALEYARRHPNRISHLIVMNAAPVTYELGLATRQRRSEQLGPLIDELNKIATSTGFLEGDPPTVAWFWQLVFSKGVAHSEDSKRLDFRLGNFTREGILRARAIEERLYLEAYPTPGYDLAEGLNCITVPTLAIHGDQDFVPVENCAKVARSIPGARCEILRDCGHFAFAEAPKFVHALISAFLLDDADDRAVVEGS